MSYCSNTINVFVSSYSNRSRQKRGRRLMQEIGYLSRVERTPKTFRLRYMVDTEDPGQRILARVVKSGRGQIRRFRIGNEEFDGRIVSVEQQGFNAREPLSLLEAVATISVPAKNAISGL